MILPYLDVFPVLREDLHFRYVGIHRAIPFDGHFRNSYKDIAYYSRTYRVLYILIASEIHALRRCEKANMSAGIRSVAAARKLQAPAIRYDRLAVPLYRYYLGNLLHAIICEPCIAQRQLIGRSIPVRVNTGYRVQPPPWALTAAITRGTTSIAPAAMPTQSNAANAFFSTPLYIISPPFPQNHPPMRLITGFNVFRHIRQFSL